MATRPSEVELGRLSVGERTRLAAENFALSVAHFFVDTRDDDSQALLIDAVASPRMDDESRDRFIDPFADAFEQESPRQFVQDAEVWLRSCVIGPPRRPREVRVELAGVMADADNETTFVTAVRVDVARRSDRWEVVDVFGPEPRASVEVAVQGLEPLLEGKNWRQVRPTRGGESAPSASGDASPSSSPTPDDEDATPPGR